MKSKKGFLRTLEAVLTILLIFSLITFLVQRITVSSASQGIKLIPLTDSLLNSINPEITYNLENCDFSRNQYLIKKLLPLNINSKTVLKKTDSLTVSSGVENFNTSFFYPFQKQVNLNDLKIFSLDDNYDFSFTKPYKQVSINLLNSQRGAFALNNVLLNESDAVNLNGFKVFSKEKHSLNVTSLVDKGDYHLVNLTVNSVNNVLDLTLFYTTSTEIRPSVYVNLEGNMVNYSQSNNVNSDSVELFVSFINIKNVTDFFLIYEFSYDNSNSQTNIFNNLTYDSKINYETGLVKCTDLIYDSQPLGNFFVSKKDFFSKNSVISLDLLIWGLD